MMENQVTLIERGLQFVSSDHRGHPLLMFHGVTRRWQTFVPVASQLSMRWQVHAMDFRGHGNSARSTHGYRVIDYLEDALAAIDRVSGESVVLYGHSLGAMVVAAAASERPDRVSAIVMEDPPMHTMGARIAETSLLPFFSALKPFAGSQEPVSSIARKLAETRLPDSKKDGDVRLGDMRDATSLQFTAACVKKLDPEVFDPILAGEWLDGFDTEHVFRNVRCPALLVQADTPCGGMLTDEDAQSITSLAPDVVRVKLPGCGHLVHWSRTAELLNHVHAFLESLE